MRRREFEAESRGPKKQVRATLAFCRSGPGVRRQTWMPKYFPSRQYGKWWSASCELVLRPEISLDKIKESKTNPRRQFDKTKLAELAGNIKTHGVVQPIVIRPLPGGSEGFYEFIQSVGFDVQQLILRDAAVAA